MRRITQIPILILLLSGCMEDPESMRTKSFSKVYGTIDVNSATDMDITPEGNIVMIGRMIKETDGNTDNPVIGPTIIKIDQNGNEIDRRDYYFTQVELEERMQQYNELYGEENDPYPFVTFDRGTRPSAQQVKVFPSGNIFMTGWAFGRLTAGYFDGFRYYMILDRDLNLIKFELFNNSQIEFETAVSRTGLWRSPDPILAVNGDILYLANSVVTDPETFEDADLYSIYRFDDNGNILSIQDFPNEPRTQPWQRNHTVDSWTLAPDGTVVVSGGFYDPIPLSEEETSRDNSIYVHRLDLNTGQQIDRVVFGWGNYNLTFQGGIQPTENGFVISDYHIEDIGEDNWYPEGEFFRNGYGGLWFVDNNLDSIGKSLLTGKEVDQSYGGLLKTQDGGFVAAFRRTSPEGEDAIIVKTDNEGIVKWRHEVADGAGNGFSGTEILEAPDGGILFLGSTDFNSTGSRITLIKLTADGQL